jgi:hypothetical protein
MPSTKRRNPFYVMLVPLGVAFVVSAFAYYVMAFQSVNPVRDAAGSQAHPLFKWLRAHGDTVMLVELAGLAVLTVAAIATDHIWGKSADSHPVRPVRSDS